MSLLLAAVTWFAALNPNGSTNTVTGYMDAHVALPNEIPIAEADAQAWMAIPLAEKIAASTAGITLPAQTNDAPQVFLGRVTAAGVDVEVTDPNRGIITTSETKKWLLVTDDTGNLLLVQVASSPEVDYATRTNRIASAKATEGARSAALVELKNSAEWTKITNNLAQLDTHIEAATNALNSVSNANTSNALAQVVKCLKDLNTLCTQFKKLAKDQADVTK